MYSKGLAGLPAVTFKNGTMCNTYSGCVACRGTYDTMTVYIQ